MTDLELHVFCTYDGYICAMLAGGTGEANPPQDLVEILSVEESEGAQGPGSITRCTRLDE